MRVATLLISIAGLCIAGAPRAHDITVPQAIIRPPITGILADGDYFGASIAATQSSIAVLALNDRAQDLRVGSVHVFEPVAAGQWELRARLSADASPRVEFINGIVNFGDRILTLDAAHQRLFAFTRSGNTWSLTQEIERSGSPGFGAEACASVDLLAAGASAANAGAGVVYVYQWADGLWTEHGQISAPNGVTSFGDEISCGNDFVAELQYPGRIALGSTSAPFASSTIDVRSSTIRVLACGDDLALIADNSLIVLQRQAGTFVETFVDAAPTGTSFSDLLSADSADTLLVRTDSGVRVYRKSSGAWGFAGMVPFGGRGYADTISMAGEDLLEGFWTQAPTPLNGTTGVVTLRSMTSPGTERLLETGNSFELAKFGGSIAVQDNLIAIGAPQLGVDSTNGRALGAVYVLDANSGYAEIQVLTQGRTGGFGRSVDIDGNALIVGSPSFPAGGAHVFRRTSGTWVHEKRLSSTDQLGYDEQLGTNVALSGALAMALSPYYLTNPTRVGCSAHFYKRNVIRSDAPTTTAACEFGRSPQAAMRNGRVATSSTRSA